MAVEFSIKKLDLKKGRHDFITSYFPHLSTINAGTDCAVPHDGVIDLHDRRGCVESPDICIYSLVGDSSKETVSVEIRTV